MCGRMGRTHTAAQIAERFKAIRELSEDLPPSRNIAPSALCPVVLEDAGRRLRLFKWGLVPRWAKDEKIACRCINARAEGLDEKPAFKDAFQSRRCLVPASGFFEWRKDKTPFWITAKDDSLLALAGLWEKWRAPTGQDLFSFTIITTAPNDLLRPVHDRMPVLIRPEDESRWLDPKSPAARVKDLLLPFPPDALKLVAVSTQANDSASDQLDLLLPAA